MKDTVKTKTHDSLTEKMALLGLSTAEANIYIHLLERGTDTLVSKIALGAQMHRQQVYATLPKLLELGLIEEVNDGKLLRYRARPPRSLERVAERKIILAEEIAKELETISKLSHEQDFEVIVGREACRVYEIERAKKLEGGAEQYIIGTEHDEYLDIMGEIYASTYVPILEKKKVVTYYLGPQAQKDRHEQIDSRQKFHIRVLKNLNLGPLATVIQGDTLSFYVNVHPATIYVIKSKKVAEGYKTFFKMLWEMGEG
jgi:sugar-specific transcriptional regulator TrmB